MADKKNIFNDASMEERILILSAKEKAEIVQFVLDLDRTRTASPAEDVIRGAFAVMERQHGGFTIH